MTNNTNCTSFFCNPLRMIPKVDPAIYKEDVAERVYMVELDKTRFSIEDKATQRELKAYDKISDGLLSVSDGYSDVTLAGILAQHMWVSSSYKPSASFFMDLAKIDRLGRIALKSLRSLAEGANLNVETHGVEAEFEYDSCALLNRKIDYVQSSDLPNKIGNYFIEVGRFKNLYANKPILNGSPGIEEVVADLVAVSMDIKSMLGIDGSLQLECDVPFFSLDFCCFRETLDLGHYVFDSMKVHYIERSDAVSNWSWAPKMH